MPGTLVISTLSDGTNSTSSTNCIQGSAKAWVNFNGTGTVSTNQTIRSSYNVSSVFKNATGVYTVNFTTPFTTSYTAIASGSKWYGGGGNDGNNSVAVGSATTPPANASCQIGNYTGTIGTTDNAYMFFAAFA
jgi:hypothetical protein